MTQILPEPNESARSYLVRLSAENDYLELKQMFTDYSDVKFIGMNSNEASIVECASNLVENVESDMFWPIPSEHQAQLSYLLHRKPVACPMCMQNQNFLCKDWQLMPISHCTKHCIPLVTHCSCGERLDWDANLLEYGCSKCLNSWGEIASFSKAEPLPEHVSYFYNLKFEDRASFLEDLSQAIYRILRPYDSIHNKIKLIPNVINDWKVIAQDGYALLTNMNAIEKWCKSVAKVRQEHHSLGEHSVFYPIFNLQTSLKGNWLIKGVKPNFTSFSPTDDILEDHFKTPCSVRSNAALKERDIFFANTQLRNHVDQVGFAEMMNCSIKFAREIFKLSLFNNISSLRKDRNSIVDIRLFVNHIALLNTEDADSTVYISDLNQLKCNYSLSDEDLALEIIIAKLPIYIDEAKDNFADAIKVNEKVIINFLETEFLNKPHVKCIRTKTAKIIGIPRKLVSQLGEAGILIEHEASGDNKKYTGKSIANFLAHYECVERWGAIHGVDIFTITLALMRNKLTPIFEPSIFKKSPELIATLNKLYCPKWQKKNQLSLPL